MGWACRGEDQGREVGQKRLQRQTLLLQPTCMLPERSVKEGASTLSTAYQGDTCVLSVGPQPAAGGGVTHV